MEKVRKLHISYPKVNDTFILDERGVLRSEKGPGVLVSMADLDALTRHLKRCDQPKPKEASEGEAQTNLRAIHAVESAYYLRHHEYAALNPVGYDLGCTVPRELGFALDGCETRDLRYVYSVKVTAKGQKFVAQARSAIGFDNPVSPGCAIPDVWNIDQDQKLSHSGNAASQCPAPGKVAGRH
jgi:hypothetical protein